MIEEDMREILAEIKGLRWQVNKLHNQVNKQQPKRASGEKHNYFKSYEYTTRPNVELISVFIYVSRSDCGNSQY